MPSAAFGGSRTSAGILAVSAVLADLFIPEHLQHVADQLPQELDLLAVHRGRPLEHQGGLGEVDAGLASIQSDGDVLQVVNVAGEQLGQRNLLGHNSVIDIFSANGFLKKLNSLTEPEL